MVLMQSFNNDGSLPTTRDDRFAKFRILLGVGGPFTRECKELVGEIAEVGDVEDSCVSDGGENDSERRGNAPLSASRSDEGLQEEKETEEGIKLPGVRPRVCKFLLLLNTLVLVGELERRVLPC